jgi:hypothetical protein
MASEREGVAAILENSFHVPAVPTVTRKQAGFLVLAALKGEGIQAEDCRISENPIARDALFDAAGARVPFPPDGRFERAYVALADPEARARWAHPAFWVFVAAGGEETRVQPTEWPMHPKSPMTFLPVSELE